MFILSWKQSIQYPSTCFWLVILQRWYRLTKKAVIFFFFFLLFFLRNSTFNLYLCLFESRFYEICLTSPHDFYNYLFKSVGINFKLSKSMDSTSVSMNFLTPLLILFLLCIYRFNIINFYILIWIFFLNLSGGLSLNPHLSKFCVINCQALLMFYLIFFKWSFSESIFWIRLSPTLQIMSLVLWIPLPLIDAVSDY